MNKSFKNILKSIAVVVSTAMLFSCGNDIQEVRDFLADKNLPIGVAKNVYTVHTDSGRVDLKFSAPLLHDFSNRKEHPYSEFPEGVRIVTFDENNDSLVVVGNYAVSWSKTSISEITGNVIINNFSQRKKLTTEQLFWDQKTKYFYTEKVFTLYTATDTIYGVGFDASEDLDKFVAKRQRGNIYINENN
ncbi:LPS export ABC transporter periplasmic protein LptC [Urechidicola vernalis]|uniref:LPS export ABC transporter periplasmic protein LptC n=1 Tax=Urechidicola vernalis TaxID=3075600 RepID=A0ABU2Y3R8_9FLAO|nr:LPS export ABC transporter periplasmic protein LptC [Urechidicola sp. P050]MDT0552847.1 LPS export ABC transporter periplasmic protein LptC [Urechidicola sp. P050]